MTMQTGACDSCGAPIQWVMTEKGRRMPVDLYPVEGGSIALVHLVPSQPPVAHVIPKADRARAGVLFISHFATCPNAARHRKERNT